jgi:ABC-type transporter Mla subunit MlaD
VPRHSRSEIRAGAVILAAFILLCVGILIIGDFESFFRPRKVYHFTFRQVKGLKPNDDVLYGGRKAGRVVSINYNASGTGLIVSAELDAKTPITAADVPTISRGLTGNVYVDIVPGLEPGEELETSVETPHPGKDYPDLSEVLNSINQKLAEITPIIESAKESVDNVKSISENVKDLVHRNGPLIDQTLANMAKITTDVQDITKDAKPDIQAALKSVRESAETAQAAIKDLAPKLEVAAEKLRDASDGVNSVVIGNRRNVDLMIENMRQASARLNIGIEDLRRNPWKLLTRNIEADPYTQNIYDAARSFSEGAVALSETSSSLESILSQGGTGVSQIKDAATKLDQLISDMQKLETRLYEALKNKPK